MRLLIIEDETDLLRRLAKTMRAESYAVDTAADGEDGLRKALENDYDAILLDAMLPKLDGWEVLARLRKCKTTSVLMLTARDNRDDRIRGPDGGADDYVVKPFDLPELLARVRALIRRGVAVATHVSISQKWYSTLPGGPCGAAVKSFHFCRVKLPLSGKSNLRPMPLTNFARPYRSCLHMLKALCCTSNRRKIIARRSPIVCKPHFG